MKLFDFLNFRSYSEFDNLEVQEILLKGRMAIAEKLLYSPFLVIPGLVLLDRSLFATSLTVSVMLFVLGMYLFDKTAGQYDEFLTRKKLAEKQKERKNGIKDRIKNRSSK